ncbi:hypothetical protein QYF36_027075 [Acer negundo]|nr:hypothetical protein QYF36_019492 [Acer negundo]KAK4841141.1 hypothetical protein QYF36_027075 [Acer negundo]
MDKPKRLQRLKIFLKRKQKPSSVKKQFNKSASLRRVLDQLLACLTLKENHGKQSRSKNHSRSVGSDGKFPVSISEYMAEPSSTPYLGIRNRRERDPHLGFGGYGGWSDSEDEQSQNATTKPLPSFSGVFDDGQINTDHDHLYLEDDIDEENENAAASEENDTQPIKGAEEIENCYIEIEEENTETDQEGRMIGSNALILKSRSTMQISNDTQHSARSPEIEDSSRIDIQKDNNIHSHHEAQNRRNDNNQKVLTLEWIFVITNFCIEVISSVLDQLSSVHKPEYALLGMLFSFGGMLICIVELIFKGRKQKVSWRWNGSDYDSLHYPASLRHVFIISTRLNELSIEFSDGNVLRLEILIKQHVSSY